MARGVPRRSLLCGQPETPRAQAQVQVQVQVQVRVLKEDRMAQEIRRQALLRLLAKLRAAALVVVPAVVPAAARAAVLVRDPRVAQVVKEPLQQPSGLYPPSLAVALKAQADRVVLRH